jgi:hypothetical protein
MATSALITLTRPIALLNGPIRQIELRPPNRAVFAAMEEIRCGGTFDDDTAARFISRLSGHSELTIARLDPADFAEARSALEAMYRSAARRFHTARPAPVVDGGAA